MTDSNSTWTLSHTWNLAQSQPAGPESGLLMGGNSGAAATAPATGAPGTAPQQAPQGGFPFLLLPIALLLVFMVFQGVMTSRREKKARAAMMSAMKKHDKVVTIGGIIGTVAEINDNDIVLRVDENSNARMRFTKAAIQQVLTPANDKSASSVAAEPKVEVRSRSDKAAV